jgi:uncharacterized membrane-anchored protein
MRSITGYLNMRTLRKVPEVTVYFWIIKLLTTALGESTSDYLVHNFSPYVAVIAGFAVFAIAMVMQLVLRRYVATIYWFAVVMVAVFGTMAADVIHIVLHVPYIASTVGFAVALVIIFVAWYLSERTLSIHSITSRRRELFYWATVIATFAMGTAVGDLTAYTFNLGFLSSGVLFFVLFAIPGLAYWLLRLNEIAAFWWAYILTRPVGAEFADWTGKPVNGGGLGIGNGPVILVLAVLIAGFVGYLTISRKDTRSEAQPDPDRDVYAVQRSRP